MINDLWGGFNLIKNISVSMENKPRKWHNKYQYLKYIYLLKTDSSGISSYHVVQSAERPSASVVNKNLQNSIILSYYYHTEATVL